MVVWREGLHLRHAAELVRVAHKFRSTISLECVGKIADLRSILSLITLCATMGTALNLEAKGEDEQAAAQAVQQVFLSSDSEDLWRAHSSGDNEHNDPAVGDFRVV